MARVTYIARRSLGPTHVLDVEYDLDIKLLSTTAGVTRKRLVQEQTSLAGNSETLYFGHQLMFTCQVPPFRLVDQPYLLEFLHSTEDGTPFTLDLHGSIAVTDNPVLVVRDDDSLGLNRVLAVGAGGATDYFTAQFQARSA